MQRRRRQAARDGAALRGVRRWRTWGGSENVGRALRCGRGRWVSCCEWDLVRSCGDRNMGSVWWPARASAREALVGGRLRKCGLLSLGKGWRRKDRRLLKARADRGRGGEGWWETKEEC